ncbi:MAG TPA: DUF1549 domain-containing protein [Chthonomonadaceae bacterium]|nr:DUF1549 domain-containing protein [Chthonomonadaceae bacterium]
MRTIGLSVGFALLCTTALGGPAVRRAAPVHTAPPAVQAITLLPARVAINGPYDEVHLLVDGRRPEGTLDVTDHAALSVADPKIATIEDGVVRGLADGATTVLASYQGRTAKTPVVVRGFAKPVPPRFTVDVLPVLTKAGCNMGACHGAGAGKGGFKLSLLGYDPDADFETITRGAGARRVSPAQPENSLLLRKPTFTVAHKGGQRFRVGSPEWRLIRDWIAAGMPGPSPKDPKVVSLAPVPASRTLPPGRTQRVTVWARYSDGTRRDATGQTVFTASDESVATVDPNGEAKGAGAGEGAIILRYQGLVAISSMTSPFAARISRPATAYAKASLIDRNVGMKLDSLGLPQSAGCTDADFLRRAYLDVIGLLPTPKEAREYFASRDPQKRVKLVDALLARPEYVDYWTLRWADILRCSRASLGDKGMEALYNWIREAVAENRPWNQFAQELLLAQGSTFSNGATNYYRTATNPNTLAETTSQVFLGVRIECAKCHNHPYERWTQNQYYQMAAFFARISSKTGERKDEPVVILASRGEVRHPKSGKEVAPCALDSAPLPAGYEGDRRAALAAWLTAPTNPFFAHEIVNRVWKHFLGRGLVEPVDDLRATNPASNPALFDALADEFVRNGYDLKRLMRSILLSQTYQRSPLPLKANERDTKYYSHYAFKRIDAEPLMDAISAATGVPDKFEGYPAGLRATQLPDTGVGSYFLDLFGRPARTVSCECERSSDPNLGQILHLMNDSAINNRIASKSGRVATLVASTRDNRQVVDELYLAAYSRYPTAAERKQATDAMTAAVSEAEALQQARTLPFVGPVQPKPPIVDAKAQKPTDPKAAAGDPKQPRPAPAKPASDPSPKPNTADAKPAEPVTPAMAREQAAEDILWALLNSKEFVFNH